MANFANIANYLEGLLTSQLNQARQTQAVWEWYNALFRIVSQNRFTQTPRVYGPTQLAAGTNIIETNAVTVFGVLIDNGQAAEDALVALYNAAATPGTTDPLGILWAPRAAMTCYVFANGQVHSSRLEIASMLGTEAGIEAGTASTTQPTVVVVYSE